MCHEPTQAFAFEWVLVVLVRGVYGQAGTVRALAARMCVEEGPPPAALNHTRREHSLLSC
jgi:hypothetical protein